MAFLISASVSVAAQCANDPNECTPKKLCEIATTLEDANTIWSNLSSKAKHVTFAKNLGMTCGVLAIVDLCASDPSECKISQLCGKATTESSGKKSWDNSAEAYVAIAKEYGLSCDVATQTTAAKKTCSLKTPEVCSTNALCKAATFSTVASRAWKSSQAYVKEAKKRGLTCGVKANLKTPADYAARCNISVANVKVAQRRFQKLGLYTSTIDGISGKGTERAFKAAKAMLGNKASAGECFNKADIDAFLLIEQELLATNSNIASSTIERCSIRKPGQCSTTEICSLKRHWPRVKSYQSFVREAKKRGLTCGVTEQLNGQLKQSPFTYANGDKYVGDFLDNKRHGQGTQTYADGSTYVGAWKNDKRDGQGVFELKTALMDMVQDGTWKDDVFQEEEPPEAVVNELGQTVCPGSPYDTAEQTNITQNWTDCVGKEYWEYAGGGSYSGGYQNGRWHGLGTFIKQPGEKYIGEWKDGFKNGAGIQTYPDGTVEEGTWKDDTFNP